jgi:hypothetical protein
MADYSNVISGLPRAIYVGPVDESLPELDDLAPGTLTITPAGNWTALGYTMNDWTFEVDDALSLPYVNELPLPVTALPGDGSARVAFEFAEKDMTAYNYAINTSSLTTQSAAGDTTGQDQLTWGGGAVNTRALLVIGTNPEGGDRVLHIPRAIANGPVTDTWNKEATGLSVEFQVLADSSQSEGAYGFTIYDITTAATS